MVALPLKDRGWRSQIRFRPWGLDSTQQLVLATILLVTTLVYLRCLSNGFVSDDYLEIVANRYLAQWSTIWRSLLYSAGHFSLGQTCYYRPLKSLWSVLNFHVFGLHPAGWHALKLVLHLWVTLLTFRIAQLLTDDVGAGLTAASVFALLPVHAEVVAWISAIPEPLAAAFELCALCCFIQRRPEDWFGYFLPMVLFAAGLLSFEGAIVFPLLVVLYVFLFEAPSPALSANDVRAGLDLAIRRSAPFVVLTVCYLAVRFVVVGKTEFSGHTIPDPHEAVSRLEAIALAPSAILAYISSLIFPWDIGPFHRLEWVNGFGFAGFYSKLLLLTLGAILACLAVLSSSRRKLYSFCIGWFVITLLPALNVFETVTRVHLPATVQDRYLYLPSFGLCVIAGDLVVRFWRSHEAVRWVVVSVFAAAMMSYAAFVWRAESFWHDDDAMLRRAVEVVPDSPTYHRRLALRLEHEGDLTGAVREQQKAVQLDPDDRFNRDYFDYLASRMNSEEAR